MNDEALERFYRESLEERLIAYLAKVRNIPLERAMEIYYHSKMAQRIYKGENGIQCLDYKVLVEMLIQTEPELFEQEKCLQDSG